MMPLTRDTPATRTPVAARLVKVTRACTSWAQVSDASASGDVTAAERSASVAGGGGIVVGGGAVDGTGAAVGLLPPQVWARHSAARAAESRRAFRECTEIPGHILGSAAGSAGQERPFLSRAARQDKHVEWG